MSNLQGHSENAGGYSCRRHGCGPARLFGDYERDGVIASGPRFAWVVVLAQTRPMDGPFIDGPFKASPAWASCDGING
jgi:hypothetical protein